MEKIVLTFAVLLVSANIFAGSFSCPVSSIRYDGNDPNVPGWTAGFSGAIPNTTYYLGALLSSDKEPTLAACMYSSDGKVDDNGFPSSGGGIWLLGAVSIKGEGQWVSRPPFNSKYNQLCRGADCTFKNLI